MLNGYALMEIRGRTIMAFGMGFSRSLFYSFHLYGTVGLEPCSNRSLQASRLHSIICCKSLSQKFALSVKISVRTHFAKEKCCSGNNNWHNCILFNQIHSALNLARANERNGFIVHNSDTPRPFEYRCIYT